MRSSGNPGIYLLTLFFIFIECRLLQSQTYKHLDQFTSDTYFPAFIEGNGAVKDTVINHLGLRVDYKFDAGDHASFTILRNYDIAPQDCSFMPDRFTITVKGGNKDDQIRIRLWEDLNLNRKFDSTDEVYASRYYPLGDSAWNTLQFPITSFKKVTGQGNNKLYLNRIRAWDIEVTSQIPSMHTGELFVNDLRFYSNYKPASNKEAALTGTFITISNVDSGCNATWTQQQWNHQLRMMKDMKLSKVIIQYSVHQNKACYAPTRLSFVTHEDSAINRIVAGAALVGIKVYVGLTFSETWYKSDKGSEGLYHDLWVNDQENIDELYGLFGASPAFGGWYIPQEINDYEWQTETKKALLFSWLQQVAAYAHQKDVTKPVIIAPYFNLWQPADLVGQWYNDLFDHVKDIDRIYPQDGIGTSLKDVHIDIPNYCRHIKAACDRHGKKFGMTVEAFRQRTGWPVDTGIFSATSTDHSELMEQIQEACQLNPADIILFNWNYYLHMK